VDHRTTRAIPALCAVVAFCLAVAACRPPAPTPRYVYLTPTPPETEVSGEPTPTKVKTPTPKPTPRPTGTALALLLAAAAPCAASEENKIFFAQAASKMRWSVYCAVLPSGWRVDLGTYDASGGGVLGVTYGGPGSAQLGLNEGAYCTTGPADCSPHDAVIGPTAFGDRVGTLYHYSGGYVIYLDPGTSHAYALSGSGMTEATFRSYAAALYKVPKP
jgi:hypothetical protein